MGIMRKNKMKRENAKVLCLCWVMHMGDGILKIWQHSVAASCKPLFQEHPFPCANLPYTWKPLDPPNKEVKCVYLCLGADSRPRSLPYIPILNPYHTSFSTSIPTVHHFLPTSSSSLSCWPFHLLFSFDNFVGLILLVSLCQPPLVSLAIKWILVPWNPLRYHVFKNN
jgi:hypothetical protein